LKIVSKNTSTFCTVSYWLPTPTSRSTNRQREPWDQSRLVHARDLAHHCRAIDLACRGRRVVATIKVRVRGAKYRAIQNRAGRKFEDMVVADRGIGRIPKPRRIDWIAEDLEYSPLLADQRNGVPFVGRDPDVLRAVEDNAVTAFKNWVSNDDIA
jgi:hypothetical protein